ncbi:hypothetical protein ACPA9J_00065 [Pseudomonas aeruginosa]
MVIPAPHGADHQARPEVPGGAQMITAKEADAFSPITARASTPGLRLHNAGGRPEGR